MNVSQSGFRAPLSAALLGMMVAGLSGCCPQEGPVWDAPETLYLDGQTTEFDLTAWVDGRALEFTASDDPDVIAEITGSSLSLTPQPDWAGTTELLLTAESTCGVQSQLTVVVDSGADPDEPTEGGPCSTVVRYRPVGAAEAVFLSGSFNDWNPEASPLTEQDDGTWSIELDLAPGAYPYKIVEQTGGAFGDDQRYLCDPEADTIQCDEGYIEPWSTDWSHTCEPGVASCNSLLVVSECAAPVLEVSRLEIDRAANTARVDVSVSPGSGGAITEARVTLNDAPLAGPWDTDPSGGFALSLSRNRTTARGASSSTSLPARTPTRSSSRRAAPSATTSATSAIRRPTPSSAMRATSSPGRRTGATPVSPVSPRATACSWSRSAQRPSSR